MAHRYLLTLQYLGYGYRGWQKQPQQKTVQGTVERLLKFLTGHDRVRTLAAGRTDAGVSAEAMPVMVLFDALPPDNLLPLLRKHLPTDIYALDLQPVSDSFSILEAVAWKEYVYRFALQDALRPQHAPFLAPLSQHIEVEHLQPVANLFLGTHDFRAYCYKPKPDTVTVREITQSNYQVITDSPYGIPFGEFRVRSGGFMRNQVRLMAGAFMRHAAGQLSLDAIAQSLIHPAEAPPQLLAPAAGLSLCQVHFKEEISF